MSRRFFMHFGLLLGLEEAHGACFLLFSKPKTVFFFLK